MTDSNDPLVSIIIPTYNRANCVGNAIDSVLKQTFTDYEIIISDDCSTDNTQEIIFNYMSINSNIKWFKNSVNSGPSLTRNIGISNSKGMFIAFLDSDDEWHPHKLERQIRKILNSNDDFGLCITGSCYKINGKHRMHYANPNWETDSFKKLLLGELFISTPSLLIKKKCLYDVGLFNPSLRVMEDYDLLIRLLFRYRVAVIPDCLTIINYKVTTKKRVAKKLESALPFLLNYQDNIVNNHGSLMYSIFKSRIINIVMCSLLRERFFSRFFYYFFCRIKIPVLPSKYEIVSMIKAIIVSILGERVYNK